MYGDFQCPYCSASQSIVRRVRTRLDGRLRFAFRHLPLHEVHPDAQKATEASEAAAAQGKFWRMHDLLFQNQAHLKDKDLHRYAAELGLDLARYAAEMDDHIYLQKVREHIEGGRRSHIRATPTFFLDGVVQDISFGMKVLHDAVASAVARGG